MAALLSLPALAFPIHNPDLFWHLSAARWIFAHRALPRADFLSFTRAGAPWADFEWAGQVLFQLAFDALGLGGVWLLKCAAMAGCWLAVWKALPKTRAGAALLALWGVSAFVQSDARPELISVLLFVIVVTRLQRRRYSPLWTAALFALWSNFHAGFFLGWAAICFYLADAAWRREDVRPLARELIVAVAATLLNPYGWGPHLVTLTHWRQGAALSSGIQEWGRLTLANPMHWPFPAWLGLLLAGAYRKRRQWHWAPTALALALGTGAFLHVRLLPYFFAAAALAIGWLVSDEAVPAWACRTALAGSAVFLIALLPRTDWAGPFNPKDVPVRAAEFLAREPDALSAPRLFDQWEWGGYLAWRLPGVQVFADGRYLFHELLPVMQDAAKDPASWVKFLGTETLTAALVPDLRMMLPTLRRYPDGSLKAFPRPWYLSYFPRADWALVYWDEQALLLVKRGAVRPDWLSAHEYRLLRPYDEAAFADASARGEIDAEALQEERYRHERELTLARRCGFFDACAWTPREDAWSAR